MRFSIGLQVGRVLTVAVEESFCKRFSTQGRRSFTAITSTTRCTLVRGTSRNVTWAMTPKSP
jgi:hypothetical protein